MVLTMLLVRHSLPKTLDGGKPEVMVPQYVNQRSEPRSLVVCPISVSFESRVIHGIVRDISAGGIFLYLNSTLPLHSTVRFRLRLKDENLSGAGEVIRIEERVPGAAIGVAIKISSYDAA